MRFVFFTHSLISCWNHGNAHFLRGVMRALARLGHDVLACEPIDGWSRQNLLAEQGEDAHASFQAAFPDLSSVPFDLASPGFADWLERTLDDADAVLVHEWNDPALVAAVGRLRAGNGRFRLFFHDTHHRALTRTEDMAGLDLRHYDAALCYGASLAERYRELGLAERTFVWHEAADATLFRPLDGPKRGDLVWIGNWGDGERSAELQDFLLEPIRRLKLRAEIRGVRYPPEARAALAEAGAVHGGWLPNHRVPELFAAYRVTVHVPRRPYVQSLPGIPTIRVFEALACGIPLVCSPWEDAENLFRPGRDYLVARDGPAMTDRLRDVLGDRALAASLAASGLETIRARHTCAHRAAELLSILRLLAPPHSRASFQPAHPAQPDVSTRPVRPAAPSSPVGVQGAAVPGGRESRERAGPSLWPPEASAASGRASRSVRSSAAPARKTP